MSTDDCKHMWEAMERRDVPAIAEQLFGYKLRKMPDSYDGNPLSYATCSKHGPFDSREPRCPECTGITTCTAQIAVPGRQDPLEQQECGKVASQECDFCDAPVCQECLVRCRRCRVLLHDGECRAEHAADGCNG